MSHFSSDGTDDDDNDHLANLRLFDGLSACLVQAPYIHMLYIMKNVLPCLSCTLQALPNLSCALEAVSTYCGLVCRDRFAHCSSVSVGVSPSGIVLWQMTGCGKKTNSKNKYIYICMYIDIFNKIVGNS